jgi:hypothetical protein
MKNLSLFSVRCILMAIALTTIFGTGGSLFAQYPLIPAESNGNTQYEWRPDLGGWRDKSTNLIWGYSITAIANSNSTYAGAQAAAPQYPQYILNQAQDRQSRAQIQENLAASETDPVRRQRRLELAATFRADAIACTIAGSHAATFSNWRVPTLSEFRSAYGKGLFSQGTNAFNFDAAPFTGYQPVNRVFYWTSDPAVRNGSRATLFHPGDGGSGLFSVNSNVSVIVVRSGP